MKKWLLCLAVVLAVGAMDLWPFPQQDAGELYLVETLFIETDGAAVRLRSGELEAQGTTLEDALAAMEDRAPGQLFLRQARRVVFCGGAEEVCDPMELPEELPMGACVYRCRGTAERVDQETLNKVLEAWERRHEDAPTLADLKNSALTGRPLSLTDMEEDENA